MRRLPPPGPPPSPFETLDQLVGSWWIYQLRHGHRFSTDDVVTGWRASLVRPDAVRCLDLGCGVGSVGLVTLGLLANPAATLVGIEAQPWSAALARRSVRRNNLGHRVTILDGDIRSPDVLPAGSSFDLITGSPPYTPVGRGVISPHPQRAACRFELRGSCMAYCEAAARWLAPDGRFVFVMAAADPRMEEAPTRAGLHVVERINFVLREGDDPLIAVMVCGRSEDVGGAPRLEDSILVRQANGRQGERYARLRTSLGFDAEPER